MSVGEGEKQKMIQRSAHQQANRRVCRAPPIPHSSPKGASFGSILGSLPTLRAKLRDADKRRGGFAWYDQVAAEDLHGIKISSGYGGGRRFCPISALSFILN